MEEKENIPPKQSASMPQPPPPPPPPPSPSPVSGWEHPFSKMKTGPKPYMQMSEVSLLEWQMVKTADECIKWHLKWTPWFSPQMIEALVKYGYNAPHTK